VQTRPLHVPLPLFVFFVTLQVLPIQRDRPSPVLYNPTLSVHHRLQHSTVTVTDRDDNYSYDKFTDYYY